jgi:hypothetical protein
MMKFKDCKWKSEMRADLLAVREECADLRKEMQHLKNTVTVEMKVIKTVTNALLRVRTKHRVSSQKD